MRETYKLRFPRGELKRRIVYLRLCEFLHQCSRCFSCSLIVAMRFLRFTLEGLGSGPEDDLVDFYLARSLDGANDGAAIELAEVAI
jgi:hypothetical protein